MRADPEYIFINEYSDDEMSDVKNSHMVICIPKNASTWLERNLGRELKRTESSHTNKVCVLRDPIERWASGVAEYLASFPGRERNERLVLEFFINAKETVLSNGLPAKIGSNGAEGLDVHTKPQNRFVSKFIPKLEESSTTWFYLDEQFTENFFSWASNKKLTIPNKYEKKENVTEDTKKLALIKYYRDLVSQDSFLMSKIKYFYQEDFDLIERVEFYGN